MPSQNNVRGLRGRRGSGLRIGLLTVGAALLAGLVWHLGPSLILDAFGRIGWYAIPALLLGAAHHATRALALRACVLRPNVLGYADALAIRLSGEAIQSLTFTGPVLAQPTKAWLLEDHGLTRREGFAATITEYLICAVVTVGMSIAGLLYLIIGFNPSAAVTGVAIGLMCPLIGLLIVSSAAIARRRHLIGSVVARLARVGALRRRLRPHVAWINRMEDLLLVILHDSPRRALAIVILEVGAQALLVFELFWLLRGLDLMAPGWYSLVIESSIKVVGIAFLFIPLQLGVAEGAYAVIFEVLGMPAAAGIAVAFLRRGRLLAIAGIGLATLAVVTRHRQGSHRMV
jgi:hypothetical protein